MLTRLASPEARAPPTRLPPYCRCHHRYQDLTKEFMDLQEIIAKTFEAISVGNPSDYMPILRPFFGKRPTSFRR